MADRYRKGSSERVVINCKVTAEAKAYLNQLAGEFAIGHAIERLVEQHRWAAENYGRRQVGRDAIPTKM